MNTKAKTKMKIKTNMKDKNKNENENKMNVKSFCIFVKSTWPRGAIDDNSLLINKSIINLL